MKNLTPPENFEERELYSRQIEEKQQPPEENLPELPKQPEPEPKPESKPLPVLEEKKPYPTNGKFIGRKTFWFMVVLILFLVGMLVANFFWFNISLSDWSFEENMTVVNQIDVSPSLPIDLDVDDKDTNNYDHTINVQNTIQLDSEDLEDLVDDIVEGVVEGLEQNES